MNLSSSYQDRWTNRFSRNLAVAVALFVGGAATGPATGAADATQATATTAAEATARGPSSVPTTAAQLKRQTRTLADLVSKTAQSIESALATDAVKTATTVYKLEMNSARVLAAIGSNIALKDDDRAHLEEIAVYVHRNIMVMQERIRTYAMAELDRVFPGEPPAKIWRRKSSDLYRPLFRAVGPNGPTVAKTASERKSVLAKMKADFADAGGTRSDIFSLNQKTLAALDSADLVEWVQIGDRVMFSAVGKHPVIADGASVSGAGSLQVIRGSNGDIMAALVSNTSGNYKPGLSAGIGVTDMLVQLGVDPSRIILTSAQPGDPSSVKLIMRSQKQPKSKIETQMRKMKTLQQRALSPSARSGTKPLRFTKAKR